MVVVGCERSKLCKFKVGVMARTICLEGTLMGKVLLVEQPTGSAPTGDLVAGYVTLAGQPENLNLAVFKGGNWLDPKLRAFSRPVVTWYRMEKCDGTPTFES